MRKLVHLSALFTLSVALGVAACGDDDDNNNNTGGTSTTGGSTNRAGTSNIGGGVENPLGGAPGSVLGGAPSTTGGTTVGGSLSLGGAGNEAGAQGNEGGAGGSGGAAEEAAAALLTDAQILGVLDTLNGGEIEEAFAAAPGLTASQVEAYAQKMINDHTSGRQAVVATAKALSLTLTPSDLQQQLKQDSEEVVMRLQHESGAVLEADYMDREVSDHEDALKLLTALDAAADAPTLKELITSQRTTVQAHYNQAVAIKAAL